MKNNPTPKKNLIKLNNEVLDNIGNSTFMVVLINGAEILLAEEK